MRVKIWGSRGSIPSPVTSQAVRDKIVAALQGARGIDLRDDNAINTYVDALPGLAQGTTGGNTPCVEITADGQTLVVDAGSGIRLLGQALMAGPCGQGQGLIHLFFSHTHWDHIQGLPFFAPAFVPGNRILIYSIHDVAPTLMDQMLPITSPIPWESFRASIEFVPLKEGAEFRLGEIRINNLRLAHPGRAYAYRFEHQGSIFVYASDAEYKHLDESHLAPYVRFYADADALIFDAQYTLREALVKEDWGHSSALIGADIARQAGVKRLLLFHHDPTSTDPDTATILNQAMTYQTTYKAGPACEVILAQEGLELDLTPSKGWSLRRLPDDETAILRLSGDLDKEAVAQLQKRLIQVPTRRGLNPEGENPARRPGLVVDLTGITRLSIVGLRALIDLRRTWEGGSVVLTGLSPQVRRVIELANFLDFFAVYPTVQAALAALEARDRLGLPGQLFKNRYQLEARLGESEMGVVFRATDIRLKRHVTIKVLSPSLSQTTIAHLLQESQRMARLSSPQIVSIFDCDEEDGLAFIVMEYVAAKSLRQLMDDHEVVTPLDMAIEILQALEYAHSKGAIHGNLKPENVLVADRVMLTDFGLRWPEKRSPLTETALLLGSLDYLAPEQLLGEPVEPSTDLYALGVILYELCTGHHPFEGESAHVMAGHLHQRPVSPRSLSPEVSRSLDHLILKLLAKERSQRYASATQVRRVLLSMTRPQAFKESHSENSTPIYQRQQRIIGREAQLRQLATLWETTQAGQGQIVLIEGEAGVGKTRLAEELATQTEAAMVLVGHCAELEGNTPYQPFIEIGRTYVSRTTPQVLRQQLGTVATIVAALLPEVRHLLPDLPPSPPLDPEQERLRLMRGFTQFFQQAASSAPWLLVLDDLHWIDAASLQMFHHLVRRVTHIPMLVVCTYRRDQIEAAQPLAEILREIKQLPQHHVISLERLDKEEVHQLLAGVWRTMVPDEWVSAIYARTEGNPFYVEQVAKGLVDEGAITLKDGNWHFAPLTEIKLPQSVRDIVLRRVAQLHPTTQDILHLASVLGPQFRFPDLQALYDDPEAHILDSLDEALERNLVVEGEGQSLLLFSHVEIHQVIYEDIHPPRRRILHERAAQVLEAQAPTAHRGPMGQIAHHLIEAGQRVKGFQASLKAAEQARAVYAYTTALTWYNQAVLLLPSVVDEVTPSETTQLYKGMGEVLHQQGRFGDALAAYTAMEAAARDNGDRAGQAQARIEIGDVWMRQGHYQDALQAFEQAEQLATNAGAQVMLADALYKHGWTLMLTGNLGQARHLGEQALALSTAFNALPIMAKSLALLGAVHTNLGQFESAHTSFQQALVLYRELEDQPGLGLILNSLGIQAARRGNYQDAVAYYAEAFTIAQETSNRPFEIRVLNNLGSARVGLGEYRTAAAELQQVAQAAEVAGRPWLAETYCALAEAYLGQGDFVAAGEAAHRALLLAQSSNTPEYVGAAWRVLGMVASRSAAPLIIDETLYAPAHCFEQSLHIFAQQGAEHQQARTLWMWAIYERQRGQLEESTTRWQAAQEIFARLGMDSEVVRMTQEFV